MIASLDFKLRVALIFPETAETNLDEFEGKDYVRIRGGVVENRFVSFRKVQQSFAALLYFLHANPT